MNKPISILVLGISLAPLGCTMAPQYARPTAPIPAEWPSGVAYAGAKTTTNAANGCSLAWREFFRDERLRQVIGMSLANNLDLRLAAQNIAEARAKYGIQRAQLLPVIDGSADRIRERVPLDISTTGKPYTTSEYDASLGVASWEIDFFGRIRSLKNAALQEYFATEQGRRSAQISLIASVASTYLALAADRESLSITENTLTTQRETERLVRRQHELGLATRLDLQRVQTQVDAAGRDIAKYDQLIAQDQNALNLLAGAAVPDNLLPAKLGGVVPPETISAGMPSEVLLDRPDVLQAEAQLKAVNANIGAARANFFPRISLTSAIGASSSQLSDLFKDAGGAWSYAPQIALPIFDSRTWFALKASKAQKEIAVTSYQNAIQGAFRDVSDALAIQGTVGRQVSAQRSLVDAASDVYRLSDSRYERGIDNYLSVLDAQRSWYAARQELVSLRLAELANDVRLYAVLGGGGQIEPLTASPTVAGLSE